MNQTTIIGNIGGDCEVKTLPSGAVLMSFSVAVSKSYTKQDGIKQTDTTWFRVAKWVRTGGSTSLAQFLTKGTKVMVQGEISAQAWINTATGGAACALEINAQQIELLGGKQNDSSGQPTHQQPSAGAYNAPAKPQNPQTDIFNQNAFEAGEDFANTDDLPF